MIFYKKYIKEDKISNYQNQNFSSYIIALTGGIGSGKSTISNFFLEHNIDIVDTDIISRKLVSPGKPALKEIQKKFGTAILNKNNSLNREKLRNLICISLKNKKWLEDLLHPLIYEYSIYYLKKIKSLWGIWVVPLLTEKFYNKGANRILVVDVSKKIQIQRIRCRNYKKKEIKKILFYQAKRKDRLSIADDIISNNKSLYVLKKKLFLLKKKYFFLANQYKLNFKKQNNESNLKIKDYHDFSNSSKVII